jgi:hypothetical protein
MVHLLIFQWWGYKMSVILMGPGIVSRAMYFNGNSGTYHLPSGLGTTGSFNGADGVESYNQIYSPNVTSLYGRDAWMAKGGQQYFMCSTISNPSANKFLAGGPAGATRLNVYSGGRPSIETITNLNNYASNLLISFSIPAWSATRSATGYFIDPSPAFTSSSALSNSIEYTGATIYMGICPTFTAAAASGRATWFWFGNYATPSDLTGRSFVTGNIGLTGSNSDLEMADTNIVSGSLYKSFGFKFHLPVVQNV